MYDFDNVSVLVKGAVVKPRSYHRTMRLSPHGEMYCGKVSITLQDAEPLCSE